MFGVDEVPLPKPRRLRLWSQSPNLTVFPSGPLKGPSRKRVGRGAFFPQA